MQILVLVDNNTPRTRYILNHVLGNMLGFYVDLTQNIDDFQTYIGPKISYSKNKVKDSIHISPHIFITLSGIIKQSFAFYKWKSLPIFFKTNPDADIPFDIFSASLYLISRHEEYTSQSRDKHNRFCVEESLAYQNGFLHIPLVDLWAKELGKIIESHFPGTRVKQHKFTFIPTIDIDNAYAFRHKGFARSLLGAANALVYFRFAEFFRRISVNLNLRPDPYDTYENLISILSPLSQCVWFVLGGQIGKFDRNIPLHNHAMSKLIKRIANNFSVGIHPSYGAGTNKDRVSQELIDLERIIGGKVSASRQHYLMLSLPQTYQILVDIGVTSDYSMGYSNAIGFRASTCTPYNFYDLINEKELPLSIVPFQMMDRALLQGLNLSPNEAVTKSIGMAKLVKDIGGTFVSVWHNESLSGINEWKGWDSVFNEIVREVTRDEL